VGFEPTEACTSQLFKSCAFFRTGIARGDEHRLDEVLGGVVDDQVGAQRGAEGPLLRPPRHGDDPGTNGLAELDAGGAQPARPGVHDQGLAGPEAPSPEEGQASAMAYSAIPPSAFLVIATTRPSSHVSAPSPAASATPHTSMPRVKGGGAGTCRVSESRSAECPRFAAWLRVDRCPTEECGRSPPPIAPEVTGGTGSSVVRTAGAAGWAALAGRYSAMKYLVRCLTTRAPPDRHSRDQSAGASAMTRRSRWSAPSPSSASTDGSDRRRLPHGGHDAAHMKAATRAMGLSDVA
jgi:hypothetical protein